MNLSLQEVGGEILAVSQFTLAGSIARGRRPSFDAAMAPGTGPGLFETFVACLRRPRAARVAHGVLPGAHGGGAGQRRAGDLHPGTDHLGGAVTLQRPSGSGRTGPRALRGCARRAGAGRR